MRARDGAKSARVRENNRRRPATAKGLARAQMQYGGDRGEIRAISTSYECYNFLVIYSGNVPHGHDITTTYKTT